MPTPYAKRTEEEVTIALANCKRDVEDGFSPTDAVNRNCHTAETYAAGLKEYNLKPVIPD